VVGATKIACHTEKGGGRRGMKVSLKQFKEIFFFFPIFPFFINKQNHQIGTAGVVHTSLLGVKSYD
jgi:hypothetical protein